MNPSPKHAGLDAYRQAGHAALPIKQRVLHVLDVAREATAHEDWDRARKAVGALISTLDYESAPEIAFGLERLYRYTDARLADHDLAEALETLAALHRAWEHCGDGVSAATPPADPMPLPSRPPGSSSRRVLGAHFIACRVYGQLQLDPATGGYRGRCPRCGHAVRVQAGEGGAAVNFVQVVCPYR